MDNSKDIVFGGVGFISGLAGYEVSIDNNVLQTIFLVLSILNLLAIFLPRALAYIKRIYNQSKKALKTGEVDKIEEAELVNQGEQLRQDLEDEIKNKGGK